jgi:hypothetical protein
MCSFCSRKPALLIDVVVVVILRDLNRPMNLLKEMYP